MVIKISHIRGVCVLYLSPPLVPALDIYVKYLPHRIVLGGTLFWKVSSLYRKNSKEDNVSQGRRTPFIDVKNFIIHTRYPDKFLITVSAH